MPVYYRNQSMLGPLAFAAAQLPASIAGAKYKTAQADRTNMLAGLEADKLRYGNEGLRMENEAAALLAKHQGNIMAMFDDPVVQAELGKIGTAMGRGAAASGDWDWDQKRRLNQSQIGSTDALTGYRNQQANVLTQGMNQSAALHPALVTKGQHESELARLKAIGQGDVNLQTRTKTQGLLADQRQQALLSNQKSQELDWQIKQERARFQHMGIEFNLADQLAREKVLGQQAANYQTGVETQGLTDEQRMARELHTSATQEARSAAYQAQSEASSAAIDAALAGLENRIAAATADSVIAEKVEKARLARVKTAQGEFDYGTSVRNRPLDEAVRGQQILENNLDMQAKQAAIRAAAGDAAAEQESVRLKERARQERGGVEPVGREVTALTTTNRQNLMDLQYPSNPETGLPDYNQPPVTDLYTGKAIESYNPALQGSFNQYQQLVNRMATTPGQPQWQMDRWREQASNENRAMLEWQDLHNLAGKTQGERVPQLEASTRGLQGAAEQAYLQAAGPDTDRRGRESTSPVTPPPLSQFYDRYRIPQSANPPGVPPRGGAHNRPPITAKDMIDTMSENGWTLQQLLEVMKQEGLYHPNMATADFWQGFEQYIPQQ